MDWASDHSRTKQPNKALASNLPRVPRKVTLAGHVPSRRALWLLRREHPCWRNVKVRTNKYLNNLIEQEHRAIKRRYASMGGLKSFKNAAIKNSRDVPMSRLFAENYLVAESLVGCVLSTRAC